MKNKPISPYSRMNKEDMLQYSRKLLRTCRATYDRLLQEETQTLPSGHDALSGQSAVYDFLRQYFPPFAEPTPEALYRHPGLLGLQLEKEAEVLQACGLRKVRRVMYPDDYIITEGVFFHPEGILFTNSFSEKYWRLFRPAVFERLVPAFVHSYDHRVFNFVAWYAVREAPALLPLLEELTQRADASDTDI
jgi:hypothetical protein